MRVVGIFFECLPDTPELCPRQDLLKENAARIAFYERYGARPIVGTAYETPLKPDDSCPPHLVFNDLGQKITLRRSRVRRIVRAILERKYGDRCPGVYGPSGRFLSGCPGQLAAPQVSEEDGENGPGRIPLRWS